MQRVRRTFNALTGPPLAQLHRRDVWLTYAQALADGVSLRKAAKRSKIALGTAFRWRHRFLKIPKGKKAKRSLALSRPTSPTFSNPRRVRGRSKAKSPGNGAERPQSGAFRTCMLLS